MSFLVPTLPLNNSYTQQLRLFSSHRWAYGEHRSGLHGLLRPWIKGVDFEDLSIPQEHPVDVFGNRALAEELRGRIRRADVFLALAGMYANHSEWMKFEINCAFALGIPILPIIPYQQERLATVATDFGTQAPVHWRGESIRSAITELLPEAKRIAFESARRRRIYAAMIHQTVRSSPSNKPLVNGTISLPPTSRPLVSAHFTPPGTILGSYRPPKY